MQRMTHLMLALLLAVVASGIARAQAPSATTTDADRDAVLAVVQAFFDTMETKDVEAARRLLLPESRFHAVGERDGAPTLRTFTAESYLKDLPGRTTAVRERMWNPEVKVHGGIASVWTPYDFWRDGTLSHCGVDVFELVKTPEGWRIAGAAYTVERDCAPSPLGPLR